MVAVMLPAVSVVPVWFLIVGVVLAAGLAPMATWCARALRSQLARRFLLAVLLATFLGASSVFAAGYCCCDDFWIIFGICVAP